MLDLALYPQKNVAELGDDMETLYGLLRQNGVFDGEAGDQIHTIVTRTHRVLRGLADELDPELVSIVPVADAIPPEDDAVKPRGGRKTTSVRDVLPDFLAAC